MSESQTAGTPGSILTIGHSDHDPKELVRLLTQTGVQVLVDVRSQPSSRWVPHANRHDLKRMLEQAGIRYLYMGDTLGGRPGGPEQDDREPGRARFEAIRASKPFQDGLDRLLRGLAGHRVCIMCAEEDPSDCHRNLLVGEALRQRGVQVLHIRGTGEIQTDEALRKKKAGVPPNQMELPLGDTP